LEDCRTMLDESKNIKKEKLVIVGASVFAQIAYEYFTHDSIYEVAAFAVERKYLKNKKLFDLPIVPFEEIENLYPPSQYRIFVALVYTQMNRPRTRLYLEAKKKGYHPVNYISSHAFVWHNVTIGDNTFIFEDNTVQPFVKIGNNVILWSGNHIGHHSIIKDNCFIASHVVVSGCTEINENCFLGVNATIADNLIIGKNCLIGAGAIILKNAEENKVYGSKMTETKKYSALEYFKVIE